jgi:hypothetical protein
VLAGADRCWQVLTGAGRCWQVLDGVGRCWQILTGRRMVTLHCSNLSILNPKKIRAEAKVKLLNKNGSKILTFSVYKKNLLFDICEINT